MHLCLAASHRSVDVKSGSGLLSSLDLLASFVEGHTNTAARWILLGIMLEHPRPHNHDIRINTSDYASLCDLEFGQEVDLGKFHRPLSGCVNSAHHLADSVSLAKPFWNRGGSNRIMMVKCLAWCLTHSRRLSGNL